MEIDSADKNDTTNTNQQSEEQKDLRYKVELTRAIKENHGHEIADAAWCPFEGGESFFATIGANQVNIYDMEVRGNFYATLLNYRNWHLPTMISKHIVNKANLEKKHPEALELKSFNAICWMKRWRDFWIVVADNEAQIHIISLTNAKCVKLFKTESNIIHLTHHPIYQNILITINDKFKCKFINTTDPDYASIYTLSDKICKLRFSECGNKFVAVLANGTVREYSQKIEMLNNNDGDGDDDDDMKDIDDFDDDEEDDDIDNNKNRNKNSNKNKKKKIVSKSNDNNAIKKKEDKKLVIETLSSYKAEDKGNDIGDIHYCGEYEVVICNEEGIFKHINIGSSELLHQWKVSGQITFGNVCKFDVNKKNDCVVYGNANQQVLIYDLKKKKLLRRVETGKPRKFAFTYASFCKNHPQSVMMVADSMTMKYDPLELVRNYFPSTVDFAVQTRNGKQCFTKHKTIKYAAE